VLFPFREKRHIVLANREVRFKIGEDKTSGKTGKPRVINLNGAALAIVTNLMTRRTSGPLFRTARGNPWTDSSWRQSVKSNSCLCRP